MLDALKPPLFKHRVGRRLERVDADENPRRGVVPPEQRADLGRCPPAGPALNQPGGVMNPAWDWKPASRAIWTVSWTAAWSGTRSSQNNW
jgi:hypothetical protein